MTYDDGVLVIGAGFGGLEVAAAVAADPAAPAVTLVNLTDQLVYRPWLIQLPPGAKSMDDLTVSLPAAARARGFDLVVDRVTGIDPEGKAELVSGNTLRFGACVVATGAHTDVERIPGTSEHAHTPCDLGGALAFAKACRGLTSGTVSVVVSGERPGPGLEYAGWLVRGVERGLLPKLSVRLVDDGGALERVLGERGTAKVVRHFTRRGHEVITRADVSEITVTGPRLATGADLVSDVTAVVGPLLGTDLGLPAGALDARGFVRVDGAFRSPVYPRLFSVGDAAGAPDGHVLPKSMVLARKQASLVAANVVRAGAGRQPEPFDLAIARRLAIAMPDFGGTTVMVRNGRLLASGRLPLLLRSVVDRSFFRAHRYASEGDQHR